MDCGWRLGVQLKKMFNTNTTDSGWKHIVGDARGDGDVLDDILKCASEWADIGLRTDMMHQYCTRTKHHIRQMWAQTSVTVPHSV
jgi:hypothetical protein